MSWKTLVYSAPLTNTQNFGNEVSESAAGTWISPLSFVDMIGSTNFAAQTQDGAVHATINQQVLQVICLFDVEFRQPCPDIGTFGSKSHQYALQNFPRSVLSKTQTLTYDDGKGISDKKQGTVTSERSESKVQDSKRFAEDYVEVPAHSGSSLSQFVPTSAFDTRRIAIPMVRGVSPRRDKG
jgi:hypothetical protein